MKKLSNITESVWTDIQKRSSGDDIRKEDDINNLDRDGLYDYLTSHYKNTNSFVPIYNSETFDTINVPFLIQGGSDYVYLSFEENEVSIPYASPYKVKGLFSKLANEFSLKSDAKTGHTWYIISPKDGSEVTNTFFIYVIDFLIDNIPDSFERGVKKIVNESIWTDMQKRSSGEDIRQEDDINNLDIEGLGEYILDHYIIDDGNIFYKDAHGTCIGLSIFYLKLEDDDLLLEYFYNDNYEEMVVTTYRGIEKYFPDMFYKMKKEYKIYDTETPNGMMALYGISPKDEREVDNKFFLEILDFIIDNFERIHPKIRKIIDKK